MLLADLGADVIKIEEPKRGDDTRSWLPPSAPLAPSATPSHLPPESTYFLAANRNKRSLTLNLKSPRGLAILKDLIRKADVLVENYIPGKLDEWGLGWEQLRKEVNPELIYVSISGYGQTGPYAKNPGYDVVIEAEAGLMHITGEPTGPPNKVGVAVTDISTGLYAHGAILSALLQRNQLRSSSSPSAAAEWQGTHIDINLFETQLAGLANVASAYLIGGQDGGRHGTSHPSIVPYQVFSCKPSLVSDSSSDEPIEQPGYLMIGAGNDAQFIRLCNDVLLRPELAKDERFRTNKERVKHREVLIEEIERTLGKEERSVWLERFWGKGIPFGPINNIAQTFEHPQAVARGSVIEVDSPSKADKLPPPRPHGPLKLVAPPVHYNGERLPVRTPPPWLGQHTEEILTEELGYSKEEVVALREEGAI
ncbi:CAIB BAIF family enzyme [Clavulina sp. PMI_390]|nr:CAIB BAIF family enzyme [Clavulina sp. PMI_390]